MSREGSGSWPCRLVLIGAVVLSGTTWAQEPPPASPAPGTEPAPVPVPAPVSATAAPAVEGAKVAELKKLTAEREALAKKLNETESPRSMLKLGASLGTAVAVSGLGLWSGGYLATNTINNCGSFTGYAGMGCGGCTALVFTLIPVFMYPTATEDEATLVQLDQQIHDKAMSF